MLVSCMSGPSDAMKGNSMSIENISMKTVSQKVARNERLTESDALWLYEHAPLNELGALANTINLQKNGVAVFYNVNRHINPTNICSLSCKFCAYSKKLGEPGGYAYEIPEMIEKAREAVGQGATELHMVGGLHPRWGYQRYVDMIAALRKEFPTIHLKAFTAVELEWMARKARKSIKDVMIELRDAGLNSFPGGGAEIFHADVRDRICETKVSGDQWIDIHRTAHQIGMRSNCTMLYGHIEKYEHRVDHMMRIRKLQDETNGFNVFIPLAFQPFQNEMGIDRYTFGSDDLRNIAVARLYLDNFKNIKSYWVMLGQEIAELALNFGANDLDGTVLEEKISRAAGGRSGMIMTRSNLENLIRRSRRIPVERTTLYDPVQESDRIHMKPVIQLNDNLSKAEALLEKLQSESILSTNEIYFLATQATIHQLTDAVASLENRAPFIAPVSIKNETPIEIEEFYNRKLDRQIDSEKGDLQKTTLSGIHPILDKVPLKFSSAQEYLRDLTLNGVTQIIESPMESDRLSIEARIGNCIQVLEADLHVSMNLMLHASDKSIDWNRFSADLYLIRTGLSKYLTRIEFRLRAPSRFPLVVPSEYLSALALARLILGTQACILSPLDGITVLSPTQGIGAGTNENASLKIVSILPVFGSDGVVALSKDARADRSLIQDLLASGHKLCFQDESRSLALKGKEFSIESIFHLPKIASENNQFSVSI
ncbi:MAG: aminofutalosine synthase MqnE [Proteobacteria bacterium]|nr:aminofutalosine synthase MqnE [Pseudomonadota bacterium]